MTFDIYTMVYSRRKFLAFESLLAYRIYCPFPALCTLHGTVKLETIIRRIGYGAYLSVLNIPATLADD